RPSRADGGGGPPAGRERAEKWTPCVQNSAHARSTARPPARPPHRLQHIDAQRAGIDAQAAPAAAPTPPRRAVRRHRARRKRKRKSGTPAAETPEPRPGAPPRQRAHTAPRIRHTQAIPELDGQQPMPLDGYDLAVKTLG